MARKPSIRYFDSRTAYYCQVNGRQRLLAAGPDDFPDGPTYKRAVTAFSALMVGSEGPSQDSTVNEVIGRRVQHLERSGKSSTASIVKARLTQVNLDHVPVGQLRVGHVQDWLDRTAKTCGPTTRTMALNTLRTTLRWGASSGHCKEPTLSWRQVQTGGARSRGRDRVLSDQDIADILTVQTNEGAKNLILFLSQTGCRPAEAMNARATHYDAGGRLIRYCWDATDGYVHKTARSTRKDRVILLPPATDAIISRLASRYRTGVLLRNTFGQPWNNHAAQQLLRRTRLQLGWARPLSPYSFRHTFATRWLIAGGSIKILADLLGTSVSMLEKHYAHLDCDINALHSVLARILPSTSPPGVVK